VKRGVKFVGLCGALLFVSGMALAQPQTPVPTPASTAAITPSLTPAATPFKLPFTVKKPVIKAPSGPATKLSAEAYRAVLTTELQRLKVLEAHPPRPLAPLLKRLDNTLIVKRADGQSETVAGNTLSHLALNISNPNNAKRNEVAKVRAVLESQLKALDRWLVKPAYQPANAQKIVTGLEASGAIRTGPLWWQQALSNAWDAVVRAWDAFVNWLNSWLPKSSSITPSPSVPSAGWLWIVFYGIVAAIIAAILWFLWRAFGGKLGRREVKRDAVLAGEDALLLSLPPEELRSRADIYASQGNFREALRHRYLGILLQLDARGVWRYDTRRTNWEHIAALRRREKLQVLIEPLSALTRRFDRVRYGGAPCDEEQWRQYDTDARQFEAQAAPPERAVEVAR
jgi:hypothetical protein